jgi:AcrR family transcriptional regulator
MPKASAPVTRNADFLTLDDIVDAATTLVRRHGVEGLTMTRLADRLGMSVGASYYYVKDKATLLDLVAERVALSVELPAVGDDRAWHVQLREHLVACVAAFLPYRGLASHISARSARLRRNPALLRSASFVNETLTGAGFDDATIDDAQVAVLALLQGALQLGLSRGTRAGRTALASSAAPADPLVRFGGALDLVLGGLQAIEARSITPTRR